jgi:hypothetical protein
MITRILVLSTVLSIGAFAQVSTNTTTTTVATDLTPALTSPALWSGGELPGSWKDISSAAGKTSKELTTIGPVFGVRPQQVQAYYDEGKLLKIEVVWLETGNFFGFRRSKESNDTSSLSPSERNKLEKEKREKEKAEEIALAPKRKEFAQLFAQLERTLPATISATTKVQGRRVSLGGQGMLRSRAAEWVVAGVNLRFVAEDDQLIGLTIQSAAAATKKLAESTGGTARRRESKDSVQTLPNGDQVITNIPMFNQGGRGYCAIGTLAMVTQYFGLTLNIDQLAAKAGYKEGDTENAKIIPIYQAAAREAKLRFSQSKSMNFRDAMKAVEKGEPVIIWRYFTRERDEVHSNFAKRLATDPTATLPDPRKDKADRAQWPAKGAGAHASIITGFNKKREEIIFTESWGENNRNRRMRAEEMEATVYASFSLTP